MCCSLGSGRSFLRAQPPLGSATEISSLAPCKQSLWVIHSLQREEKGSSVV